MNLFLLQEIAVKWLGLSIDVVYAKAEAGQQALEQSYELYSTPGLVSTNTIEKFEKTLEKMVGLDWESRVDNLSPL